MYTHTHTHTQTQRHMQGPQFFLIYCFKFPVCKGFPVCKDPVQLGPISNPRVCSSSKLPYELALYILHNTLFVFKVYSLFCFLPKSQSYPRFLSFETSLKKREVIISDIIILYFFPGLLPSHGPLFCSAACQRPAAFCSLW